MAPKNKGKGALKVSEEVPEDELVMRRREHVIFAPRLDARALKYRYQFMWGRETTGHPATRVIPGPNGVPGPDRYPFFVDYLYCGLCPPFLDFFNVVLSLPGSCVAL